MDETGMSEGVKEGVEGGDRWRTRVKEVKKGVEGGDGDERRSKGRRGISGREEEGCERRSGGRRWRRGGGRLSKSFL